MVCARLGSHLPARLWHLPTGIRDFLSVVSVLTRSSPTTTVDNIIENVRNPAAHHTRIDREAIAIVPRPARLAVLLPERFEEWRTPLCTVFLNAVYTTPREHSADGSV